MTKPPLADVPIHTAEELIDRWAGLLEPPIFGARSLWLTWLDDGLMLPFVFPVDDIPLVPDHRTLFGLLTIHDGVVDAHIAGEPHLAMALCRPGRPEITEDDDEWAEALREILDDQIEGTWSLHVAAGGHVVSLVDVSR
jgi:hypothetical protein